MDKTTFSYVYARVCGVTVFSKENQIPRAYLVGSNHLPPKLQAGNRSGCDYAGTNLINMSNQATAIKAGLWGVAAEAVRRANQSKGVNAEIDRLLG